MLPPAPKKAPTSWNTFESDGPDAPEERQCDVLARGAGVCVCQAASSREDFIQGQASASTEMINRRPAVTRGLGILELSVIKEKMEGKEGRRKFGEHRSRWASGRQERDQETYECDGRAGFAKPVISFMATKNPAAEGMIALLAYTDTISAFSRKSPRDEEPEYGRGLGLMMSESVTGALNYHTAGMPLMEIPRFRARRPKVQILNLIMGTRRSVKRK
ncbi:hypothetical protein B2J93_3344 [Marssonina coronariae]|uniref:Uncharacterized protein n=1 Tax=Diplocarpon coronariae TaxID=2795749 RepID=A0A218Z7W5_9HELO|nr:hypothetical protein B2J93_3344 [Marssonina coronariae]